ncbi:MAG: FtsQ-type POTRA domain-containing protein [Verrucomicrobiales bacterium]
MFKRRTSNSRQSGRMKRLEVRVMSPRIAWFGLLKVCGRGAKCTLFLALAGAAGWGAWLGIQRTFLHNPEFQLRLVQLNPNEALDEADVVKTASIDLRANLFALSTDTIRDRLAARPEISDVSVERRLPSTLSVQVKARTPRAWIAPTGADTTTVRRQGGLLVDPTGFVYPCPSLQWEVARDLPVILVPTTGEGKALVAGSASTHPELQRALRLLSVAIESDPEATRWIDRIEQPNLWSLQLVTRSGTVATIGFSDQQRQITDLATAIDHASRRGYGIATINLIPERNIPITTHDNTPPPRAVPVPEPTNQEIRHDRRSKDLKSLLNRG